MELSTVKNNIENEYKFIFMSSQLSINLNCMASDSKQMETSEENYMYFLTSLYRETVKLMCYISFSVDKYLNYVKST